MEYVAKRKRGSNRIAPQRKIFDPMKSLKKPWNPAPGVFFLFETLGGLAKNNRAPNSMYVVTVHSWDK